MLDPFYIVRQQADAVRVDAAQAGTDQAVSNGVNNVFAYVDLG